MVAKRDLYSRFPAVPNQAMRGSQGKTGGSGVASINPQVNRATSNRKSSSIPMIANPVFNPANSYSDAVARNIRLKRAQYYRSKATESIVLIAVNLVLSLAATIAIARLLPYQSSQKERLEDITTEVNSVEQRVNGLRDRLPQTLNSGSSQDQLLRKQGWIKNNQMTIKLLEPSEIASPNNEGVMPTTTTAQRTNIRQNQ